MSPSDTATTHGAREHARAQAAAIERFSRSVPPGDPDVLWRETVEGGNYATRVLPRGARLTLRDPEGDTSVQLLVFNHHHRAERLNVPDTVKVQWQAYLGAGGLLLSDMGRVLMSVESDSSAGHDTFNAMSNRAWNDAKYGGGAVHAAAPNAATGSPWPWRRRGSGDATSAGRSTCSNRCSSSPTDRSRGAARRRDLERPWCCGPTWMCSWR